MRKRTELMVTVYIISEMFVEPMCFPKKLLNSFVILMKYGNMSLHLFVA